jgi:hypothetical protein
LVSAAESNALSDAASAVHLIVCAIEHPIVCVGRAGGHIALRAGVSVRASVTQRWRLIEFEQPRNDAVDLVGSKPMPAVLGQWLAPVLPQKHVRSPSTPERFHGPGRKTRLNVVNLTGRIRVRDGLENFRPARPIFFDHVLD